MDLDEAREHLESMINQMNTAGMIDEADYDGCSTSRVQFYGAKSPTAVF